RAGGGGLPGDAGEPLLAGGGGAGPRPMTAAFIHFGGTDEVLEQEGPEALADTLEQLIGTVQRVSREHQVSFFETDIAPNGGKIMLMAGGAASLGNDEETGRPAARGGVPGRGPL